MAACPMADYISPNSQMGLMNETSMWQGGLGAAPVTDLQLGPGQTEMKSPSTGTSIGSQIAQVLTAAGTTAGQLIPVFRGDARTPQMPLVTPPQQQVNWTKMLIIGGGIVAAGALLMVALRRKK